MRRSGATRRRIFWGAAALIAAISFSSWRLGLVAPSGGPLHSPGNAASTRLTGGANVTAIFSLADSEIDTAVELRSVEVAGADDRLEVGTPRMIVCEDGTTCAIPFFHRRWPPRGSALEDADGYVMDGTGNTLVGITVEVPEEPGRYRLRGLSVDYRSGLRRYRAEVGPNMTFIVRDRNPPG